MLLALQNLDAKYREPLVAELLSMSRELRRLTPGRMVHIWFIYGSYMVHIWFIYGSYMIHIARVDIQWDILVSLVRNRPRGPDKAYCGTMQVKGPYLPLQEYELS